MKPIEKYIASLEETVLHGGIPVLRGDVILEMQHSGAGRPAMFQLGNRPAVPIDPAQRWNTVMKRWLPPVCDLEANTP